MVIFFSPKRHELPKVPETDLYFKDYVAYGIFDVRWYCLGDIIGWSQLYCVLLEYYLQEIKKIAIVKPIFHGKCIW